MKALLWLCASFLLLAGATGAQHSDQDGLKRTVPWTEETLELAARLPVQDGGRVKPLSTFASFTLLQLNGKRSLETPSGEKIDATAWLLDTLFFPLGAAEYEFFHVDNDEVISAMGLRLQGKKKSDSYSLMELEPGFERLFDLANQYHGIPAEKQTGLQRQVLTLATNLNVFAGLSDQLKFTHVAIPVGDHPELARLFADRHDVRFSEVVAHAAELRTMGDSSDRDLKEAALAMLKAGGMVAETADLLAVVPPAVPVEKQLDWYAPGDVFHAAFDGEPVAPAQLQVLRELEGLSDARMQPAAFEKALGGLLGTTQELADARGEYSKIPLEVAYYKSKLIRRSLIVFIASFLAMTILWLRPRSRIIYGITSGAAFAATMLLVGAIVMRCIIRGRPPVSTLFETLIFVTAVACSTALVVERINRRRIALSACVVLGVVGLFLAERFEVIDKKDTMPTLQAVLDTNFWLATHVTCITSGYAAGMLAALLANLYIFSKLLGVVTSKLFGVQLTDRAYYSGLARMVYGVLAFAVIFSTVGTILGGIWANDSWGRFWGWDPKENGALLIVISQLAILHGRMGGYLREHGVCLAVAFAGSVIAFSWFGVNLLGVGLHSYGFTEGRLKDALWTYYYFQWGTVAAGGLVLWLERRRARALAPPPAAQPAPVGKKLKQGTQPA